MVQQLTTVVCEYDWSTGDTINSTEATTTGYYTLELTNNCNKTAKDSCSSGIPSLPITSTVEDTNACDFDLPITFNATGTHEDSMVWSNGTVGEFSTYNTTDTFYVDAVNRCGYDRSEFIVYDFTSRVDQVPDYDTCIYFDEIVSIPISTLNLNELTVNGEVYSDSNH